MKIRFHRGMLAESMETVQDIEPTEGAVREYLTPHFAPFPVGEIEVKPYGFDERIGWDTHIVTVDGHGTAFTDGPTTPTPKPPTVAT